MKFEKNNSYGKGRQKGSVNKSSKDVREAFKLLVEDNIDKLQADIDTLDSFQRLKIILELSSYVIPRLKQIDQTITASEPMNIPVINWFTSEENTNEIKIEDGK